MTKPIKKFGEWFDEAKNCMDIVEPTAMALATATSDGKPSVRMVLLKAHDDAGFVFYTNNQSRKGRELEANNHAALSFYWGALHKQVRIEGMVSPVSDTEADAYFHSRPRGAQIAACVSKQSAVIAPDTDLKQLYNETEAGFEKVYMSNSSADLVMVTAITASGEVSYYHVQNKETALIPRELMNGTAVLEDGMNGVYPYHS